MPTGSFTGIVGATHVRMRLVTGTTQAATLAQNSNDYSSLFGAGTSNIVVRCLDADTVVTHNRQKGFIKTGTTAENVSIPLVAGMNNVTFKAPNALPIVLQFFVQHSADQNVLVATNIGMSTDDVTAKATNTTDYESVFPNNVSFITVRCATIGTLVTSNRRKGYTKTTTADQVVTVYLEVGMNNITFKSPNALPVTLQFYRL
jgi:hypothetical protein